ncbi:MAG: hypothetical protein JW776_02830 [Candidatus Lokiarchaeota archaeon]|nr:hypothetical protein [Candidatus Lokiarchaeota archaeon]
MGEILERGLMIGFGLTITIFLFSVFSPVISLIFSDVSSMDQYDMFIFTIQYGITYNPQYPEEELCINASISFEISLEVEETDQFSYLTLNTKFKSITFFSSKSIILLNYTVQGDIQCIFYYPLDAIILSFWERT